MATTKDQVADDREAYGLAFDEADVAAEPMNEDAEFGITPDAEETPMAGEAPAVAVVLAAPEGEPAATEAAAAKEPALDVEKERQRLKSWEGRLKAQQAELEAKANQMPEPAEAPEMDEGEDKEGGAESDIGAAVAMLTQDFGDEFVQAIKAIAKSEAMAASGEALNEVGATVEAIIADITDTKQRMHFEKIYDAHPDFLEVSKSPEFAQFLAADPNNQQIAAEGNTREVIDLLGAFKAQQSANAAPEATAAPDAQAVDGAEGVRSTGLRLPEAPEQTADFKEAWDKF